MHSSIGIDSTKFVREASIASLRALAFSSSLAGTMPSTRFWLGQMMPHDVDVGGQTLRIVAGARALGPRQSCPIGRGTTRP